MKKSLSVFTIVAAVAALLSGCASNPTSAPEIEASQTQAPAFTEAEKERMSQEEKVALYNDTVAVDDPDRIYCRRQVVTGSHRKVTVCKTAAEIKEERLDSQEALWRMKTGEASNPGGN